MCTSDDFEAEGILQKGKPLRLQPKSQHWFMLGAGGSACTKWAATWAGWCPFPTRESSLPYHCASGSWLSTLQCWQVGNAYLEKFKMCLLTYPCIHGPCPPALGCFLSSTHQGSVVKFPTLPARAITPPLTTLDPGLGSRCESTACD